jgi:hypothetical protein
MNQIEGGSSFAKGTTASLGIVEPGSGINHRRSIRIGSSISLGLGG